jgi:hypothetical protein
MPATVARGHFPLDGVVPSISAQSAFVSVQRLRVACLRVNGGNNKKHSEPSVHENTSKTVPISSDWPVHRCKNTPLWLMNPIKS